MKNCRKIIGEHEFYCCGARVLLKNGEIKLLTKPRVVYCPLFEKLYGIKEIDENSVKCAIETKIRKLGFCCADRVFNNSLVVPYGSSEIISTCMREGLLDCAVTVCEGAGTVITGNPSLVQEIGARLTGIIRTNPVKNIINYLKNNDGTILDESAARIDQYEGVLKAVKNGYKSIAVTVAGFDSKSILKIRGIEGKCNAKIAIFSICNTCVTEGDVERILSGADVVCASASKLIREKVGSKALLQLGVAIPVFALTEFGKKLILTYLMKFDERIVIFRTRKTPYIVEEKGPKIIEEKEYRN